MLLLYYQTNLLALLFSIASSFWFIFKIMKYKKIVTVVVDSFGIGQAKDAKDFNDEGADTFGHILAYRPNLKIDHLYQLGLGNLNPAAENKQSLGLAFKMNEASCSRSLNQRIRRKNGS